MSGWLYWQWDSALGSSDSLARELFEGITGVNGGTTVAWGTTVQPALSLAHLRIETTSQIVVVIPQILNYEIASPETLTVRLPAGVLASRRSIVATPQLVVQADSGVFYVTVENSYYADGEQSIQETGTTRTPCDRATCSLDAPPYR